MENPSNTPHDVILAGMASTLILQSQNTALYILIQELAQKVGATHLAGYPVKDAFRVLTTMAVQKQLIRVEDSQPAFAALVLERLEKTWPSDPGSFGV